MKKLLKFGIASLSLSVLIGAGLGYSVQADELADSTASTVAIDSSTQDNSTVTTEEATQERFILESNGFLEEHKGETYRQIRLDELVTQTVIDPWAPIHLDLPVAPSDKQETDSWINDTYEMNQIKPFPKTMLESANFKTLADLEAFETSIQPELDALGIEVAMIGYEDVEYPGVDHTIYEKPKSIHRAHYDREALKELMTSLGYAEGSYEFSASPVSYRFRFAPFINPLSPESGYSVERTDREEKRLKTLTLAKDLLERANQAAAKSWEEAPTPVTDVPKLLATPTAPVQVEVSGQDSKTITGIEAHQVTDPATLAKFPASMPQADTVLYDIKTVNQQGQFVQISESAKVTLSIDPSRKVLKVVYFLPETGAVENLAFTVSEDGKTVSFTVTHFSQYGVVYEGEPTVSPAVPEVVKTINVSFNYLDASGKIRRGVGDVISLKPGERYDLRPALPGYRLVSELETLTYEEADPNMTYQVNWQVKGEQEVATKPVSPASIDMAAERHKLLLSLDESGLSSEQKGQLAEKIAFAETEKELAALKTELVNLVKAAEKPANKPAKEAPKTESKAPAAAAKPAANTPGKSDKAALPATGDVTRVGLIAAGFSLLLLGLGLAKSRKHN